MKRKLQLLLLLTVCSGTLLHAQGIKLTGKVVENGTQKTLPGVGIILMNLKDTTQKQLTTTDNSGIFDISGLKANTPYRIKATYLGFYEMVRVVEVKNNNVNIGVLAMQQKSQMLKDVVIEGQAPPAIQKGDTTELNASAFKVNPDANAQDLVQKMPGVTIENGTIKAHGEEVKRILVDGKNYFGEDPSMALQNLPAEVIDKVQIYNKMSDQAEFTGFDDGNSSKVMNIITRADKRNGTNGLFSVGSNFDDKYAVSGRFNVSQGIRRLSITGGSNNVNMQNFNMQDLLGAMSSGNRGGGGGRGRSMYIGRQGGLNTTHSIGINYTDALSSKITLTGSYFFNLQENRTDQLSNTQNIVSDTTIQPLFQDQWNSSKSNNYNHRFDLKLEYTIDSMNSLIWTPRFTTQQNKRNSLSNQLNYNTLELPMYNLDSKNGSNGLGYNFNNDLVFRHKFAKKGRTISLGASMAKNLQNSDGTTWSLTTEQKLNLLDTALIDQTYDSKTEGETFSANVAYTEPTGKNGIIQLGYNASFTNNSTNRYSYDQTVTPSKLDTTLSNVYKNQYNTQRAGVTYRVRSGEKLMASFGLDYQRADLTGKRTFPQTSNVDKTFGNALPNAMLNYKISQKTNVRVQYRSSTNPPSINQLQDVVTVSNSKSFSQGNPDLKHEYTQNLVLNYRTSNPDKNTNFSFNVFGVYSMNSIGNAVFYMKNDSVIVPGDTLKRGGQLSKPINFDESWNTRMFMNYGILFKPLKCNLNFIGGIGYSTSPGSIDNILSTTEQYNLTGGLVIGSNISQNMDFTVSYNANYTIAKVTYQGDLSEAAASKLSSSSNTNTWYHSVSLRSNMIWKGFVLQNSLVEQINSGLSGGYNQNFLQWNVGLGKKFLKNNAAELKLTVYDVLNQNQNITHTVSALSISDSRTNTLQRYFLVSFTYNLRNYKTASGGDHDHGPGFGRGGMRPF